MIQVIILAAGKGTRMKSDMPKVLHPVKGVPIVKRLIGNIASVCPRPTLIVGHKAEDVMKELGNGYDYVVQKEQLGTGHAIKSAKDSLKDKKHIQSIIVLPGDHPLVTAETLTKLVKTQADMNAAVILATTVVPNFEGEYSVFQNYGRIIRGADGLVDRIVEYKDATEEERASKEVNLSYYCFDAQWLWSNIDLLKDNNVAKEFYLTDMIKIANDQGKNVAAFPIRTIIETYGINTPEQLKMVEMAIA